MKKSRWFVVLIALVSFFMLQTKVHASSAWGYDKWATKHIVTTKSAKIYRIYPGKDEASNQWVYAGRVNAGTPGFITNNWIMSTGGGYVFDGGNFYASKSYFYFVKIGEHTSWFRNFTNKDKKKEAKNEVKKEKDALRKAKNKDIAYAKKLKQKLKQFKKTYPIIIPSYQRSNDKKMLAKVDYDLDGKDGSIEEDYAPNDRNAIVPSNYTPKNMCTWDVNGGPNGDGDWSTYTYLDNNAAKIFGYSTAGWVKSDDKVSTLYVDATNKNTYYSQEKLEQKLLKEHQ